MDLQSSHIKCLQKHEKKYFIICHRKGGGVQGGFDKCQYNFFKAFFYSFK